MEQTFRGQLGTEQEKTFILIRRRYHFEYKKLKEVENSQSLVTPPRYLLSPTVVFDEKRYFNLTLYSFLDKESSDEDLTRKHHCIKVKMMINSVHGRPNKLSTRNVCR